MVRFPLLLSILVRYCDERSMSLKESGAAVILLGDTAWCSDSGRHAASGEGWARKESADSTSSGSRIAVLVARSEKRANSLPQVLTGSPASLVEKFRF
jgi:hypothetical protein